MLTRKEPHNVQSKEPHNGKDRKEPHNGQSKEPQNGKEEEQVDTLKDIGLPRKFLLSKRHYSTTQEYLSEIWGLSLAQATITLKAITQKLVRSAVMPLARRYRADSMFDVRLVNSA